MEAGPPCIKAVLGKTEAARTRFAAKAMLGCSFRAVTAVEEDAPQAWPANYKVTCTGKIWACDPAEDITHRLLQAVESGAVLGTSETKLHNVHKQQGHTYRRH